MYQNQIFKNICVATDGSEASMKAAKIAIRIAKQNSANLFIIYVIDDKVIDKIMNMSKKTAEAVREEYYQTGNNILEFLLNLAKKAGVVAENKLDEGYPSEKIINYTNQKNIDLLIIGNEFKKQTQLFNFGSNMFRMIELVNCPILIIR